MMTIDQLLSIKSLAGGGAMGGSDVPRWSPDGSMILFLSSLGGEADFWAISPEGGFPRRLTSGIGNVGFLSQRIPLWSPTGEYVSYLRVHENMVHEVWLWPADGGPSFQLTRLGGNINSLAWAPHGRSIVLACNRYGAFDIYTVEVPSGKATRLTRDKRYEVYPTFTPDGARIAYVRLNDAWTDHDVIVMNRDGSGAKTIIQDTDYFDYHYGRTFGYPKISPDGRTVLFRSHRSGWQNFYTVSIEGGEPQPVAAAEADQSEAEWSPDGGSVLYCQNHDGTVEIRVASPGGAPKTVVRPEFGLCGVPQWSPDGKHISYLCETPTAPADLWVVDVASGRRRRLTNSLPDGKLAEGLVTPEKLHYKTWDGLTITYYLYKPPVRKPGERFPLVFLIHGGPTSQFMDNYQPYAQWYAMNGYVVALPNVRGSSGYGKAFEKLNNGDWGHGDLKDVIALKEHLAAADFIDPQHTGITGTSYGGCMSMSAVGFAPGVFQASIPCSGYGDWEHFYLEQELRHIKLMDYEFGPLAENRATYLKCSPIHKLADATCPTFLIHGVGGYPRSDASALFAKELERKYKAFKYKTYEGDNYYVRSPRNTRQMLLDQVEWFNTYLKGPVQ